MGATLRDMRQQRGHFVWGGLALVAGLGQLAFNLANPAEAAWGTCLVALAVGSAFVVVGLVQGRRRPGGS